MTFSRKLIISLAAAAMSLFGNSGVWAETVTMHTPANYQVLSISPNAKWACGVFVDAGGSTYPFRWNLESGSIEILGTEEGTAFDVANDGTVSGDYPDTEVLANHAPLTMPCYWRGSTRYGVEMPEGKISDGIGYGISPDGKYTTGSICKDGIYTSYIWNEGKISRSLSTGNHNVAFCVSPDGKSAAGYNTLYNRVVCYWPADGEVIHFQDSEKYSSSPWNYARNFSPDGKKLLYWGGWELSEDESTLYLYSVYDIETGERKKIVAPSIESDVEFFDISNNEMLVGYDSNRGYVWVDGEGMYIDQYLEKCGVKLGEIFDDFYAGTDFYINQLPVLRVVSVSEDENVLAMWYYNPDGELSSMVLKMNQDFTSVVPAEVAAVQLEGLHTVALSWKRPIGANNIRGYNVYRDGKKLNSLPLNQLNYFDENLANGEYTYEISATTTAGVETRAAEIVVNVAEATVAAPYSLFARQKGVNTGFLTWNAPLGNIIHKHYYDIEAEGYTGFSVYEPIDMEVAIRYSKAEVAAYAGHKISEVSFMPMGAHNAWAVNLYTHDADNNLELLYSEPITKDLAYGELNTIKLATPQRLPAGDLVVAIETTVNSDIAKVLGAQNGPVVEGYSDLLRQKAEDDFYSAFERSQASGMSVSHISWVIDLGLEPEDGGAAELANYQVYLDGEKYGTTTETTYETSALASGKHVLGVEAQYADGNNSEVKEQQLTIVENYPAVENVEVEVSTETPSEFIATWQTPKNNDLTDISYTTAEEPWRGIRGNASSSYAFMAAVDFMQNKLRGYDGYRISAFRFYPLADAIFTFLLYEDGKLIYEYEVEDPVFNEWNTCYLPDEVIINENAEYRLILDCFDPEPEVNILALDSEMSFDYISDLVSIDNGETWNSLQVEAGTIGNWMMGMLIESPESAPLTVDGYDVMVDGKAVNKEMVESTSFTGNVQTGGSHRLKVNTYYPGQTKAVEGAITTFTIDLSAIQDVAANGIRIVRDTDILKVEGDGVRSINVYSASGSLVASAKGNRVGIGSLTSGVYVVKVATTNGDTAIRMTIK